MQTLQLQDVYKVYIHGTSKEKLRNELELTSLYNRGTFHRLLYFHTTKNNLLLSITEVLAIYL